MAEAPVSAAFAPAAASVAFAEAMSGSGRPRTVGGSGAAAEASSHMVRAFPALPRDPSPRRTSEGARDQRDRRFLGLALPAWILAGALSVVLIIGGLVILPRIPRGAAPPDGLGDGELGGGIVSTGQSASTPNGGGAPPGGVPGVSASATTTVVPAPPALEIASFNVETYLGFLDLLPNVLGWKVTFTIHNPADVPQDWENVAVWANGWQTGRLGAITSGLWVTEAGSLICAGPAPGTSPTIAPKGNVTVQFKVASREQPRQANPVPNNPNCVAPQAS
jgi:hypothetical protein